MVVELDVPMEVSQAARYQTPELAPNDAVKVPPLQGTRDHGTDAANLETCGDLHNSNTLIGHVMDIAGVHGGQVHNREIVIGRSNHR